KSVEIRKTDAASLGQAAPASPRAKRTAYKIVARVEDSGSKPVGSGETYLYVDSEPPKPAAPPVVVQEQVAPPLFLSKLRVSKELRGTGNSSGDLKLPEASA